MTQIDRAFGTVPWDDLHLDPMLQALSSSIFDHCPILLSSQQKISGSLIFCFEAHWPCMSGYIDYVKQAWDRVVPTNYNAMMSLHIKLARTTKALTILAKSLMPQGKLVAAICREVINRLESYQESRLLSIDEQDLLKLLKTRLLGLAAIERSRARQKPRLTWIRKEDANTRYFHIMAKVRKKNNYITSLSNNEEIVSSQEDKQHLVFNHYLAHTGTCMQRMHSSIFMSCNGLPETLPILTSPLLPRKLKQQ
jgi:hypothetical protein